MYRGREDCSTSVIRSRMPDGQPQLLLLIFVPMARDEIGVIIGAYFAISLCEVGVLMQAVFPG